MPSPKFILTIDLGTTGPKAALFSTTGKLIGYDFQATPRYFAPQGGAEQNPSEWWEAIVTATHRLLSRKLVPVDEIAGICCTAQWSGTVAVDRAGEPLMNAIIWMDSRGGSHVQKVVDGPFSVRGFALDKLFHWIRLAGGVPGRNGKDSIAHILYLKHEDPALYEKTFKFLEPKDYLNLRLTGRCAASYDSITLHWITDNRNLSRIDYSTRLMRYCGVDRDKFPDLNQAVDILGPLKPDVAEEMGLPADIPVVMGTPDVHSAAIGSGAIRDFEGHLYVGSSSWIACHVPFKKTSVFSQIGTGPSPVPGRYLAGNEQEHAGACLEFVRKNLLYPDADQSPQGTVAEHYQELNAMAQTTPAGSHRLIFTPWLYGERSPVDDETIRGGFANLSANTTRADLVTAVYEGVAYNSKWLLSHFERFVGRRFGGLNVIGGGARSDPWCQIFADVLDRNIRQVKDPILANSRGAASLAAVALGYTSFEEIAKAVEFRRVYQPNPDHRKIYDELFHEFIQIYRANKKIHARLNSNEASVTK